MTKESHLVAPEGYLILAVSFILAVAVFFLHSFAGVVGGLWFLFCVYFFRNPKRFTDYPDNSIIVPADGTIISIGEFKENHFLNKPLQKISIFMSPFNVHVNRSPVSGVVSGTQYFKGKYLAAFDENAGEQNERSAIHVKTDDGEDIVFVQVAGWFARRIITYPKVGDLLVQGKIFGLIKFGSRMDVYFSQGYEAKVKLKQKVFAGQTVLASKQQEAMLKDSK